MLASFILLLLLLLLLLLYRLFDENMMGITMLWVIFGCYIAKFNLHTPFRFPLIAKPFINHLLTHCNLLIGRRKKWSRRTPMNIKKSGAT